MSSSHPLRRPVARHDRPTTGAEVLALAVALVAVVAVLLRLVIE